MTKQEFMKKLEGLLQDIPEVERQDALKYYYDYFEDAQEEIKAINDLGSPERVANLVRTNIKSATIEEDSSQVHQGSTQQSLEYQDTYHYQDQGDRNSFTPHGQNGYQTGSYHQTQGNDNPYESNQNYQHIENGYQANSYQQDGYEGYQSNSYQQSSGNGYKSNQYGQTNQRESYNQNQYGNWNQGNNYQNQGFYTKPNNNDTVKNVLIVLACIFAIPIGIPLVLTCVGLGIGLLITLLGLVIGTIVLTISFYVGGFTCVIEGISLIFIEPAGGILAIGIGMILLAIALLVTIGVILLIVKVIPLCIKGIKDMINKKTYRGGRR